MPKNAYNEALAEVNSLIDGQGTRIDTGIRRVVAGLRMHGVNTVGSCEGHLDHGYPYPWIDIGTNERLPQDEPPVDQTIQNLASRLQNDAAEFGQVRIHATVINDADWFYVEADPQKFQARKHVPRTISAKIKAQGREEILLVTKLLDEFYRAHPTPYFTMIGVEPLGSTGNVRIRLQSNGAQALNLMAKTGRTVQLRQLQSHMNDLADFLIGA